MNLESPYLSVVATARNDDHGGNLLARMQTFVNALLAQGKRHGVRLELIVVEWNPPADKPGLAEALEWPADLGSSSVRIITVPPELHQRYGHAGALPLYQMIAKNVGIRRASGQFVLATNIDIVFSDELFQFFRERRLERGKMYRVDRHDVMQDVPVDPPVDEQLAYCRSHLLRLFAKEGTFPLTPEGSRKLDEEDIACHGSGILFGRGWSPAQQHCGVVFRWVHDDAEIIAGPSGPAHRALVLDLEPGPGVRCRPFRLLALAQSGATLAEDVIADRTLFRVPLPLGGTQTVRLRVVGGGHFVPYDLRVLNLRVFRCTRESAAGSPGGADKPGFGRRFLRLGSSAWHFGRRVVSFLSVLRHARGPVRIGLPLSPALAERLRVHVEAGGISLTIEPTMLRGVLRLDVEPAQDRLSGEQRSQPAGESPEADGGFLHINACGDFTLMAREHWLDLRGYPEFDLFSMNIDSALCYGAHYSGVREEVLEDPIRIYHIEHSAGSGWTPEGDALLFERLAAKGIPWLEFRWLAGWANQMRWLRSPMIFNHDNWGLAEFELPERVFAQDRP